MPPTEYSPTVRLEICNGRSALASRTALHSPIAAIRLEPIAGHQWGGKLSFKLLRRSGRRAAVVSAALPSGGVYDEPGQPC